MRRLPVIVAPWILTAFAVVAVAAERPRDFVDAATLIPDLLVDMRYATPHNFMGRPLPGYVTPRCLLTRAAGKALQCAADALRPKGYRLKTYDCYRPQRAVNAFVAWGRDLADQKTKPAFYPEVDKRRLFRDGYIASRSGHSRGSTIDLTIVPLAPESLSPAAVSEVRPCDSKDGQHTADGSVDMGTGFDCFSPLSHTASSKVGEPQRQSRLILHSAMRGCGFINNRNEWWHYTLRGEPYPGTYFDFPVQ